MDWQEIVGGILASLVPVVIEHMRHRTTVKKYLVVVEGVEIATQQLGSTKEGKASADLVKMHIRSVATKQSVEKKLHLDVKKVQATVQAAVEADTKVEKI